MKFLYILLLLFFSSSLVFSYDYACQPQCNQYGCTNPCSGDTNPTPIPSNPSNMDYPILLDIEHSFTSSDGIMYMALISPYGEVIVNDFTSIGVEAENSFEENQVYKSLSIPVETQCYYGPGDYNVLVHTNPRGQGTQSFTAESNLFSCESISDMLDRVSIPVTWSSNEELSLYCSIFDSDAKDMLSIFEIPIFDNYYAGCIIRNQYRGESVLSGLAKGSSTVTNPGYFSFDTNESVELFFNMDVCSSLGSDIFVCNETQRNKSYYLGDVISKTSSSVLVSIPYGKGYPIEQEQFVRIGLNKVEGSFTASKVENNLSINITGDSSLISIGDEVSYIPTCEPDHDFLFSFDYTNEQFIMYDLRTTCFNSEASLLNYPTGDLLSVLDYTSFIENQLTSSLLIRGLGNNKGIYGYDLPGDFMRESPSLSIDASSLDPVFNFDPNFIIYYDNFGDISDYCYNTLRGQSKSDASLDKIVMLEDSFTFSEEIRIACMDQFVFLNQPDSDTKMLYQNLVFDSVFGMDAVQIDFESLFSGDYTRGVSTPPTNPSNPSNPSNPGEPSEPTPPTPPRGGFDRVDP